MDGNRTMPSSEEVASLEEYIPTRLTTFTILKCTIIIPVAEFNLLDHLMPVIMGGKVCTRQCLLSCLYQHVLFHRIIKAKIYEVVASNTYCLNNRPRCISTFSSLTVVFMRNTENWNYAYPGVEQYNFLTELLFDVRGVLLSS